MNSIKYSTIVERSRICEPLLAAFFLFPCFHLSTAEGGVTVTVVETASGVSISAAGTLNLTILSGPTDVGHGSYVVPGRADFALGPVDINGNLTGEIDQYTGFSFMGIMQVPNFGDSHTGTAATVGTGDIFGISGLSELNISVSRGYQSGERIESSSTFNGATISSLGMRPGVYVWSWGSGDSADSVTMTIPGSPTVDNSAKKAAIAKAIAKAKRMLKVATRKKKVATVRSLKKKIARLKRTLSAL